MSRIGISGHRGTSLSRPDNTYTTPVDSTTFSNRNGVFSATVVDNADPDYNGSIWVRLTGSYNNSGTDTQDERHDHFTKVRPIGTGGSILSGGFSQQYGESNTPPTIESEVLVAFSGQQEGYLLGVVTPAGINASVPGISGSPLADDPSTVAPSVDQQSLDLQKGNERIADPMAERLVKEGIIEDPIRGLGSEGGRRESPSRVSGQRTPGGHSIVMDDGTETFKEGVNYSPDPSRQEGTNKLIRIRSSSGHQLLLNDEAGIVYIMQGDGKSWIQMDADGNIDVYAEKNISYHAEDSINFYAADAFNVEADVINMKARGDNINLESATADINLYATKDAKITADLNVNIKAGGDILETSVGGNIHLNGPVAKTADKPTPEPLPLNRSVKKSINSRVPEHEPYNLHTVQSKYLAAQARSSMEPDTKDLRI